MNLLKRFFGCGCSHRFNWPRIDADGRHYQRCPLCGTAYEFDWSMMRRTDRVLATNERSSLPLTQTRADLSIDPIRRAP